MKIKISKGSSIRKAFVLLEKRIGEENYIKVTGRRIAIRYKSYDRVSYLRKRAAKRKVFSN